MRAGPDSQRRNNHAVLERGGLGQRFQRSCNRDYGLRVDTRGCAHRNQHCCRTSFTRRWRRWRRDDHNYHYHNNEHNIFDNDVNNQHELHDDYFDHHDNDYHSDPNNHNYNNHNYNNHNYDLADHSKTNYH